LIWLRSRGKLARGAAGDRLDGTGGGLALDRLASSHTSRRAFMRMLALLGILGPAALRPRNLLAAAAEGADSPGAEEAWPAMTYRTLGRTGYRASRLVFGCGSALSEARADHLLETALAAGVNVFDVGTRRYYDDAEKNLAPFLKKHRDEVFLISKGLFDLDADPDESLSPAQTKSAAGTWLEMLDDSLGELGVERVDAYSIMGVVNPSLVSSEEMYDAFLKAKTAGKVRFFGLSAHKNTANVLQAAIDTGWYDLAMLGITPAGWYDWDAWGVLQDTPDLVALRPLLDRARAAGIGLVGMKAARSLAGRKWYGGANQKAFDKFYGEKLLRAELSAFQRSYAYVLEHGLDVVNADMQSPAHLRENFIAAATSHRYFG
jgi:aryl-alcohol dehydrogenase-like predicted oxidoreductase